MLILMVASISKSVSVSGPLGFLSGVALAVAATSVQGNETQVSFRDDVRPILARNCFECHGPDEGSRKAGLRLDLAEAAYADQDGVRAIVPGDPGASEAYQRVITEDPDDRMPPPESHAALSPVDRETLRRWIVSGAEYQGHWAFERPQRPAIPSVQNQAWTRNAIDFFILSRLEEADMEPSPSADPYTLVRRVYLDLIGIPPTPTEVDRFIRDDQPGAYQRVVDRLLASPRYGERWARPWLDLARYSDTNGYEKDRERSIWPYRDWVIRALNADLPYDQFSIEQLAGDMLPNATESQRVATGFHRNTMLNEEGGIDPLEYRFYAMVDRVATTGTVWMGLTTGCAQCHSHKYDPISHTEYYGLMALLNNADEPDLILANAQQETQRAVAEAQLREAMLGLRAMYPVPEGEPDNAENRTRHFHQAFGEWMETVRDRLAPWSPLQPSTWKTNLGRFELMEDRSVFASGDATKRDVYQLTFPLTEVDFPIQSLRLEALPDDRLPAQGPGRAFYEGRKGDFFLSELVVRADGEVQTVASGSRSYGKISVGSGNGEARNVFDGDGSTGWATSGREGEASYLVLQFEKPIEGAANLEVEMIFERHFVASLGRFRISVSADKVVAVDLPTEWEGAFGREHVDWTDAENEAVQLAFIRTAPELAEARKTVTSLERKIPSPITTMVLQERPADHQRATVRHHRGEYLSPREAVEPGIPAILDSASEGPSNRLELAQWLVSERNPLVGRVTVNRAWRSFFGRGLLQTSGDFGTQSDRPSHPELLDWLAAEFQESGWSMKRLHRMMVLSQTYRQSAVASDDVRSRDPENRLLARAPRVRLEGEMVRDTILAASGLLVDRQGGPSVRPPQPASVTALAYGGTGWPAAKGADRYRRSLYTYSKRTAPFAAFTVFDAPSGENCTARRNRSNTPLQALTLLNDAMYQEYAVALARSVLAEHQSREGRAIALMRRLVTRPPDAEELEWLLAYQAAQFERLASGDLDAAKILGSGKSGSDAESASWVMLARSVMNLDETITK